MSAQRKSILLMALVVMLGTACTPNIPTAKDPLTLKQSYSASSQETWEAVLQTIQDSGCAVINESMETRLVSFAFTDKETGVKLLANTYIKETAGDRSSDVYLLLKVRSGPYRGNFDQRFFGKLDTLIARR